MNKIIPTILCATALFGCRTHSVTPDESWSDYHRYYSPTGQTALPANGVADIRMVKSAQREATLESLKKQGYVVLGSFTIDDGTEISQSAVSALAQKLNAGAVVWSSQMTTSRKTAMPNPDFGMAGVDPHDVVQVNSRRPDESFAEQTLSKHEIFMLGKKK